jgi:drug/metabolite transporter (DMT)-like permease
VVATLLAVPLMGEIPGLGDLAGAAIVVTGLTLATRPGKAAA